MAVHPTATTVKCFWALKRVVCGQPGLRIHVVSGYQHAVIYGIDLHVELQDRISALKLPPLLWDLGQVTDSTTLRTMEGKKTIIFLLSFVTCSLAIPREEFYSFGQNSGDTTVPSNDDGSSKQITLQFGSFSYFEKQYTNLFVSYLCYQQQHHNANLFIQL